MGQHQAPEGPPGRGTGKLFGKLAKAIEIAAREGGGNPDFNPTLATAIYKAKVASMPNDNIDRAVKRGTGEVEGAHYEEILVRGIRAGGVACMFRSSPITAIGQLQTSVRHSRGAAAISASRARLAICFTRRA